MNRSASPSSPHSSSSVMPTTSAVLASMPVAELIRFVSTHIEEAAAALDVALARPAQAAVASRRLQSATKETLQASSRASASLAKAAAATAAATPSIESSSEASRRPSALIPTFSSPAPQSHPPFSVASLASSSQRDSELLQHGQTTPTRFADTAPQQQPYHRGGADSRSGMVRTPESMPATSPQAPHAQQAARPLPHRRGMPILAPLQDHDTTTADTAAMASAAAAHHAYFGARVPLRAPRPDSPPSPAALTNTVAPPPPTQQQQQQHSHQLQRHQPPPLSHQHELPRSAPLRSSGSFNSQGFAELTPLSSVARDDDSAGRSPSPNRPEPLPTRKMHAGPVSRVAAAVALEPPTSAKFKPSMTATAAVVPMPFARTPASAPPNLPTPPRDDAAADVGGEPTKQRAVETHTRPRGSGASAAINTHGTSHQAAQPQQQHQVTPRRPTPATDTCYQVWSAEKHRELGELLDSFPTPTSSRNGSPSHQHTAAATQHQRQFEQTLQSPQQPSPSQTRQLSLAGGGGGAVRRGGGGPKTVHMDAMHLV